MGLKEREFLDQCNGELPPRAAQKWQGLCFERENAQPMLWASELESHRDGVSTSCGFERDLIKAT